MGTALSPYTVFYTSQSRSRNLGPSHIVSPRVCAVVDPSKQLFPVRISRFAQAPRVIIHCCVAARLQSLSGPSYVFHSWCCSDFVWPLSNVKSFLRDRSHRVPKWPGHFVSAATPPSRGQVNCVDWMAGQKVRKMRARSSSRILT